MKSKGLCSFFTLLTEDYTPGMILSFVCIDVPKLEMPVLSPKGMSVTKTYYNYAIVTHNSVK